MCGLTMFDFSIFTPQQCYILHTDLVLVLLDHREYKRSKI